MSKSVWLKLVLSVAVVVCSLSLTGCPSKEVIVLDNFPTLSLESLWDDCVSFFTGNVKAPFEVGDIIVGTGGGGFLRRVVAINQRSGKVTADTEFVSLAEAVAAGTLDAKVEFTHDDFVKSGVPLSKASDMTIDLSGIVLYSKDGVTVSISSGSLTIRPSLTLNAVFNNNQLSSLKALTEGDVALDLNLRVQATGQLDDEISWETNVIPPITKPFVFYIGPVPVAGTASLSIPFGIAGRLTGTASVESGFDTTTHIKLGAQLEAKKWTNLSSFGAPETNAHPIVVSFSSSAGVDVYCKVKAGLNLYGASDLTGYVQPYLAADANFVPSPFTFVLGAGINGGLVYQLGIFDINLIDKNWFFPGPYWELYRYTLPYDVPTTFTFAWPEL